MNITRISGIMKKEFLQYFVSPMAWIVIAAFLITSGYFFSASLAVSKTASLKSLFEAISLLLLLVAPVLTMRVLSEERKAGTMDLMLSYPITEFELVFGKFLALLSLFLIMLIFTLPCPAILFFIGNPDPGPIIAGYIGLIFLGGTCISAGMVFSALTDNQIISSIVSFAFLAMAWGLGILAGYLPAPFSTILAYASPGSHFVDFTKGIFDIRDMLFFLSTAIFFLFSCVKAVEAIRWR